MRNPFTSVSNISFLRNGSRVSQQTKDSFTARSLSSHRYFDYKSSYLHDTYLLDYDARRQQENKYCQVMGIEAMRFRPDPPPIENEYYAMEINCRPPMDEDCRAEENCTTEANSQAIQSAMKNTKDMFGSDYFTSRSDNYEADDIAPKKSAIKRKDTNGTNGSSRLRFKKQIEINCPQLSEQPSQQQDSFYEQKEEKVMSNMLEDDPKTIYLKSKKKVFYLYQDQCHRA